jgi:hypothetical protein
LTPENFVYWLNGYFELGGQDLTEQHIAVIKDHISLVLNKTTPTSFFPKHNGLWFNEANTC